MAKLKIKDLPRDMKVSEDQLKRIKGGFIARPAISTFGAPARLKASGGSLLAFGGRLRAASGSRILDRIGGILDE